MMPGSSLVNGQTVKSANIFFQNLRAWPALPAARCRNQPRRNVPLICRASDGCAWARDAGSARHYGVTNPERTKAILDKYVKIKNPEFLEATYQDYVHITDPRVYPNMEGIRFALEEVAKRSPSKGRKPEEFVNLRFLQELECEGFFKELYGK